MTRAGPEVSLEVALTAATGPPCRANGKVISVGDGIP
jgi:hypothetical protein